MVGDDGIVARLDLRIGFGDIGLGESGQSLAAATAADQRSGAQGVGIDGAERHTADQRFVRIGSGQNPPGDGSVADAKHLVLFAERNAADNVIHDQQQCGLDGGKGLVVKPGPVGSRFPFRAGITRQSARTDDALNALFALGTGRTDVALRTDLSLRADFALRSLNALFALGADRTDVAPVAVRALGAGRAGFSLFALRAGVADIAFRTLFSLWSLNALFALRAGFPLWTDRTDVTFFALVALDTLGTDRADVAVNALRTDLPMYPLWPPERNCLRPIPGGIGKFDIKVAGPGIHI